MATISLLDPRAEIFLEENNVHPGWITFIKEHTPLVNELNKSIRLLEEIEEYIPDRKLILRALTICPPAKIKVVIVAQDPIPDRELATGLAFSFPVGTIDSDLDPMSAMVKMHTVLRMANILGAGSASCYHEAWAEKGVLLLNAVLTVRLEGTIDGYKNRDAWIGFTKALIRILCKTYKELNIICWGTYAKVVADGLTDIDAYNEQCTSTCTHGDNDHSSCNLFVSDHPTNPREPEPNNFPTEGTKQFIIMKRRFPSIFNIN